MNNQTGIYKSIGFSQFCDAFRSYDRNENFSYKGKRALFDYLESLSEDTGEAIKLDVIALCCEYSEYTSAYEAMKEYQPEDMPLEGEEGDDLIEIAEKEEQAALEWLEERTSVIPFDGGVIIAQF